MFALDIETIPNKSMVSFLPKPEVALGSLKDPEKIKAKVDAATLKQVEKMGLEPETGRICSFSVYGDLEENRYYEVIREISDYEEKVLITKILNVLRLGMSNNPMLIITWNGNSFDFPYIYKRAAILGVELPTNTPGLTFWTKRYSHAPHCDLMQWWVNWYGGKKLDFIGTLLFGEGKIERDYSTYVNLIESGKQNQIGEDNICDTKLTFDIYNKVRKYFFSTSSNHYNDSKNNY